MKRLLITGARGFIGRACIEPALKAGFEVHALSSGAPGKTDGVQRENVHWRQANLLEQRQLDAVMDAVRPSHMLHMAWETGHGSYWTSPENLDWLAAGARLAAIFAKLGGKRFVAAGTCAEYAWGTDEPMTEGLSAETPHTFYGRIKLAHHHMLMAAAAQLGFSAATGRIFFAYGPYENSARIIPYACMQLRKGEAARFSSGVQARDFMHVDDVGRGFVSLLESNIAGACNVSSGLGARLGDIVERLGQISGRPDLIQRGALPDRADDVKTLIGKNDLLRSTGWSPTTVLEAGLKDAYIWWGRNTSL